MDNDWSRITIEQTGGFANVKKVSALSADDLPADRKAEIDQLLDAAREAGTDDTAAEPGSPTTRPDRFSYVVTIEGPAGVQTVQLSETHRPQAWGNLIKRVRSIVSEIGPHP